MIRESFEVDDLTACLAEVMEEARFSCASEPCENVKVGLRLAEAFSGVIENELTIALVATIEDAGAPADGSKNVRERPRSQSSSPAVDEGLVASLPLLFQSVEMFGGVERDVASAKDSR